MKKVDKIFVSGGRLYRRNKVQAYVSENEEELLSKISEDMIDSIAYGVHLTEGTNLNSVGKSTFPMGYNIDPKRDTFLAMALGDSKLEFWQKKILNANPEELRRGFDKAVPGSDKSAYGTPRLQNVLPDLMEHERNTLIMKSTQCGYTEMQRDHLMSLWCTKKENVIKRVLNKLFKRG